MSGKSQFSPMDFLLNLKKGQIEKHKFWGSISQFYKENTVPDIQLFVIRLFPNNLLVLLPSAH